jgi:thymidylate synthase (FAD)
MEVNLVAITQPRVPGVNTAEEFVAYAARVSNPSNQMNTLTAPKLLAYLVKHKHWSPFEMVSVVMEINTTRDIGRQILRHRSFSFQEFSQRYANANEMGFVLREARLQDQRNRQASLITEDRELIERWDEVQTDVLIASKKAYSWAINNGIAKEQARAVLPEGMTKSRMYMSGTLRSWIHACQVRCGPETQKETRELFLQAREILLKEFPSISEVFNDIHSQ